MADGRKVKMNVEAVNLVDSTWKTWQMASDGETMRRIRRALKAGKWSLLP